MSAPESAIPQATTDTHRAAVDGAALRRVATNAIALVLAYALPRILTMGAVVLAARTLGTERFGAYGAAGAAAVIFSILSTAGMQPLLVREMVKDRSVAPVLLRNAHWVKTVLNVVMIALIAITAESVFGLRGEAFWAAVMLTIGYAVGSYAENFAAYFQAIERMHVWTTANAAYGIVAGISGAILIVTTHSLAWFCGAMILGQVATVAWLYRAYRQDHVAHVALLRPGLNTLSLLRSALPFAAAFLALTIYCKADVLMLSRVASASDAGLYTAAYKLVDIAQALMLAAIIATYPRLTRAALTRTGAGTWAAGRYAELAIALTAPAACLGFVWRHEIMAALYGSEYAGASLAAGLLALALIPLSLNLLAGYVVAASNRIAVMAPLYGAAALVKLTAVAIVAPRWGVTGVGAVMLGSEIVLCIAFQIALHNTARAAAGSRALVAVVAAGAVCGVVSVLPVPAGVRGTLLIALIAVAYTLLRMLTPTERAAVASALRRRRDIHAVKS